MNTIELDLVSKDQSTKEELRSELITIWEKLSIQEQVGMLLVLHRKLSQGDWESWIRKALMLTTASVSLGNADLLEDWVYFNSPHDAAWLEYFWAQENCKDLEHMQEHFPTILEARTRMSRKEFVNWFSNYVKDGNS